MFVRAPLRQCCIHVRHPIRHDEERDMKHAIEARDLEMHLPYLTAYATRHLRDRELADH